jgi:hypothetical protein
MESFNFIGEGIINKDFQFDLDKGLVKLDLYKIPFYSGLGLDKRLVKLDLYKIPFYSGFGLDRGLIKS